MIDLLQTKGFAGRSVLEFGAGHSTLWWAARASRVVAFEHDAEWAAELRRGGLPAHVTLHLTPVSMPDGRKLIGEDRFDVVVVDGMNRAEGARIATEVVTPDGVVIVDNSEGFWTDGPIDVPIQVMVEHFRNQGFQRVDFYGLAPMNTKQHCTSVFFRDRPFLFAGTEDVARYDPV